MFGLITMIIGSSLFAELLLCVIYMISIEITISTPTVVHLSKKGCIAKCSEYSIVLPGLNPQSPSHGLLLFSHRSDQV